MPLHLLSTSRLELKPWTAHSVIAAMAGPAVLQLALGLKVHPQWPNPDFGEALPELADDLVRLGEQGAAGLIVRAGPAPEVIGELGCKDFPDELGAVEVGFGVVPAHQRQGLATEALQLFAAWLLSETPTRIIRAQVREGHRGSQRVLEKSGFAPGATQDGIRLYERRR